jgi:ATP-grasp domain, R2K clade family 2
MILVLGARYSDDSRLLGEAARIKGWQVVRLTSSLIPDELHQSECRVYAEGFLAEHLAHELGLVLLRPADDVLAQLEFEFAKRQVSYCRAKDFKRPTSSAFIKPADQKLFPARVYTKDEPIDGLEHLQPDDPILVSEVVTFSREYRFFVRDRQVLTGSIYLLANEIPQVPIGYEGEGDPLWKDAIGFARQVVSQTKLELSRSVVLDVGLVKSGNWAVIEFNPVWASGIYGCDPLQVIECLEASQFLK